MLLTFALIYAGCTALCLSMHRHFQQLLPKHTASQKTILILRLSGWSLLTIATIYCATIQGLAIAVVCLCGFISAAAFVLILLLSYKPRFAILLAIAAPFLGLVI